MMIAFEKLSLRNINNKNMFFETYRKGDDKNRTQDYKLGILHYFDKKFLCVISIKKNSSCLVFWNSEMNQREAN